MGWNIREFQKSNIIEIFHSRKRFESREDAISFLVRNNIFYIEIKDVIYKSKKIFVLYHNKYWCFCESSFYFYNFNYSFNYNFNYNLSSNNKILILASLKNSFLNSKYEKYKSYYFKQYIITCIYNE